MEVMRQFKQLNLSLNKNQECVEESYRTLRRAIGILGILLPLINMAGGFLFARTPIQGSISGYYYTNMRDVFVGLLCVVALFLITYKGYNVIDKWITTATGILGLLVAFFPCSTYKINLPKVGIFQFSGTVSDKVHLVSAALFFLLLAFNSYFLFTLSDSEKPLKKRKKWRNRVYRICAVVMVISISGAGLCSFLMTSEALEEYKVILIFEAFALLAFGTSWLVKGETLFKDEEHKYKTKTTYGKVMGE